MNAIMNKTNSSKRLLAAIVAIAMIVCAIAVIMPADSVQAAPNDGTSGVEATDIASEADLLELDTNSDGIIFTNHIILINGINKTTPDCFTIFFDNASFNIFRFVCFHLLAPFLLPAVLFFP